MLERVLVDSDSTIVGPAFSGADEEAAATATTPTVAVVSLLTGDTLTAPTVSSGTGTGVYNAALTAADHTGNVDLLELTWTGTVSGKARVLTQRVEVVGGYYTSIPELRALSPLSDASKHPGARLKRLRAACEDLIERQALGVAFVPRAQVDEFYTNGQTIRLRRQVRELVRVLFDDVEQTVGSFEVNPQTSRLSYVNGGSFPRGTQVTVCYRHGYDHPPVLLVEAVREYVRAKAVEDASTQNRNADVVTMANGETYRFYTANPGIQRWTGLSYVDDRINSVPSERVVAG